MAHQRKSVAFEVYTVDLRGDNPGSLRQLVEAAHASGEDRTVASDPYRVTEFDEKGGTAFADIERNRLSDPLPTRAKRGHKSKPLNWDDDEGPGHSAAFAMKKIAGREVLILQRNRNALGARQLERVLLEFDTKVESLSFHRVLTPDAYERITRMKRITAIKIKVATPNEKLVISPHDSSGAAIEIAADLKQASIELVVKAGLKSSLKKSTVERVVRWWDGLEDDDDESVSQFKVWGTADDEDGEDMVNLLREAMTGWAEIEIIDRRSPFASRRKALVDVLAELEPQIAQAIKQGAR